VYTRPAEPPKVYLSAFGPKAISFAGRIADGYISVQPNGEHVEAFRNGGGADLPVAGGFKSCFAPTDRAARHAGD
jgi:alkanesulfonate monooxygenase SsuD/methylene tetrahydromethanopterin reductase-like flavin-dependent oxidoreductase (luciferase family)